MNPSQQIEVLDLRHFSARQLRPLLEEESRRWSDLLSWDYRSSADLLLQYLDSRVLPGFVALDRGRVCGYVFCVHEANKAVIGDAFASPSLSPLPTAEVENRLLVHLVEMLQNSPQVDRIEAQLLLHAHGLHAAPFAQAGFRIYPRLYMQRDLRGEPDPQAQAPEAAAQPAPALRKWSPADFQAAGELIQHAYLGHLDSRINNQYRTVAGSLRFLHNIVRFPGCGVFDSAASLALPRAPTDAASGPLDGLLLCSRIREDVGHITQICVAHKHRRLGLGRRMVAECIANLQQRNFNALTLTVTEANSEAVTLYEALGFHVRHRFDAMVWDPSED